MDKRDIIQKIDDRVVVLMSYAECLNKLLMLNSILLIGISIKLFLL